MGVVDQEREEKARYAENESTTKYFLHKISGVWERTPSWYKGATLGVMVVVAIALFFYLKKVGVIIAFFLDIIVFYLSYQLASFNYRPRTYNTETGQIRDTRDLLGDAALAGEEEKADMFESGYYDTLYDNIVAREPNDIMKRYAVRRSRGMNGNVIIFGSPGSGKSVSIAIPTIFQTIRRGESLIVTDPKGELYMNTHIMARAHGYTVKVLNLTPRMMAHSDSVNFMSVVGNDDLKAESLAETIINNTMSGDKKEFWDKSEQNLLKAMVLIHSQDGSKLEKTLPAVYRHLAQHKAEDIAAEFDELDWDSPAMGPGASFSSSSDKVIGDTKGGLAIRLGSLNNAVLQKVAGVDDIDFTLPGREKCIYYVVSSDHDKTLMFYQSLFFTLLFQELADYADFETENQSLPVKVTFLMDEFKNIGKIPAFPETLATFRGRNMDIIIILQNLGQLQSMYPNNEWASIIDCCSTMMLLRTNDLPITAKFISERSGIMTTITSLIADNDALKLSAAVNARENITQRKVLNADQVVRMKNDEILVVVSGHNIARLKKNYYFDHPMCKEMRKANVVKHVPKWMEEVLADFAQTGDMSELSRYGIKTTEQLDRWLQDLQYEENLVKTVDFCTKDDFKRLWTKEDQERLDKRLKGIQYGANFFEEDYNVYLDNYEGSDATELANDLLSGYERTSQA